MQLEDPSVSGRHAQIEQVGEDYQLTDLESTNGTRVNGELITTVTLRVGDRIRFGKVEACFECEVPDEAQPLPALRADGSAAGGSQRAAGGFRERFALSASAHGERSGAAGGVCGGGRSRCWRSSPACLSLAQMRAPMP